MKAAIGGLGRCLSQLRPDGDVRVQGHASGHRMAQQQPAAKAKGGRVHIAEVSEWPLATITIESSIITA